MRYEITYTTHNTYDTPVKEGLWQFMVLPEDNASQQMETYRYNNSLGVLNEESVNGFGFKTLRITSKDAIDHFEFSLRCTLEKTEVNPFEINDLPDLPKERHTLSSIAFKADHEQFLTATELTRIPLKFQSLFIFDQSKSIFDNLVALNHWSFEYFTFKTEVTSTETSISYILENRQGVCQDFTHVFCGLARLNQIPTRYVSGYLHQGRGLAGDSQMHAWIECYIPKIGWTGFDPTNNLLTDHNHIKVSHGRDYQDCAPLKGFVLAAGTSNHHTSYTVFVKQISKEDTVLEPKELEVAQQALSQSPQNIQQWQQQQ